MGFDLYTTQQSILTELTTEFPNIPFFENTVPEDEQLPRESGAVDVNPFIIYQFGPMMRRPRGRSMKGPRNDDYYSWVQFIGMASVTDDIRNALAPVVDRLIGFKPTGGNPMVPDGGPGDYGSRQYSVRPVLYYQSQRFEFGLNQNGLDGFLTP